MSTDANLVLATPEEMRAACPGYRQALAEPVTLTTVNPFTNKPVVIETWDPEPFAAFPEGAARPPELEGLKHAYKDGLDACHLRSLASALGEASPARAVVPWLIVPPDLNTLAVELVAPSFHARLAAMTDDEAAPAAHAWAAAIHADDSTCERWIKALRTFAAQARDQGRRIFAVIEES